MVQVGIFKIVDGYSWEHVRDPDGNEGFVPLRFLASQQEIDDSVRATKAAGTGQPAGGCTDATRRYIASTIDPIKQIQTSLAGVSRLSARASANPRLLVDADWQLEYVVYLGALKGYSDGVVKMSRPSDPLAGRIHSSFVAAAQLLSEAATLIARGLDDLDATTMEKGAQSIDRANPNLNRAAELMKTCT